MRHSGDQPSVNTVSTSGGQDTIASYRTVILGAGVSGLCMGIALRKAGITSFVIIEKAAGIGGTWWDNTYPGAECDVRLIFTHIPSSLIPAGHKPMRRKAKSRNTWCDAQQSSIFSRISDSIPR